MRLNSSHGHLPQTPAEILTGRIDGNQPSQPPAAINAARSFGLPVELHPLATIPPTQRLKLNVSNLLKLVLSMFRPVHAVSAAVPKPRRRRHAVARLGGRRPARRGPRARRGGGAGARCRPRAKSGTGAGLSGAARAWSMGGAVARWRRRELAGVAPSAARWSRRSRVGARHRGTGAGLAGAACEEHGRRRGTATPARARRRGAERVLVARTRSSGGSAARRCACGAGVAAARSVPGGSVAEQGRRQRAPLQAACPRRCGEAPAALRAWRASSPRRRAAPTQATAATPCAPAVAEAQRGPACTRRVRLPAAASGLPGGGEWLQAAAAARLQWPAAAGLWARIT